MSGKGHIHVVDQPINRVDSPAANPTLAKLMLAKALAEMAERDGRSSDQIGAAIPGVVSGPTIARWLKGGGKRGVTPRDLRALCEALGADEETIQYLCVVAEQAKAAANGAVVPPRDWQRLYQFDMYAAVESGATRVDTWEPALVPGLAQTPAYAEVVIRDTVTDDAGVAERVRLRMDRQTILHRPDRPAVLHAVISETVLHSIAPEHHDIMREQLEQLLRLATLGNVTFQVMPFSAGPRVAGSTGPFVALEVTGIGRVVYEELPANANYRQRPEEIARYDRVMERLRTQALGPEASVAKIAAILKNS